MKKSFFDYFKHEYPVELTVRPDEIVPGSEAQLWNRPIPEGASVCDGKIPWDIETARALAYDQEVLRDRQPDWLRLSWSRPEVPASDDTPHISASQEADAFGGILRQLNEVVGEQKTMLSMDYRGSARNIPDIFYDAAVFKQLRQSAALVGQVSFTADEDRSSAVFTRITEQMLPLELVIHDSGKKPIPVYTTPGGAEVPLLMASASCSEDRTRVFLLMVNRHPYRIAVVRVRLYGFPEMRPGFAAAVSKAGTYKEVKLRKYRLMDHVNLEVPPAKIAVMRLDAEQMPEG